MPDARQGPSGRRRGGPSRLRPRGLRTRLTLLIAAILVLALGAMFVAIYRGTGADLRGRVDRNLAGGASALVAQAAPASAASPRALAVAARRYIANQPFRAAARLIYVVVPGAGTFTNQPELLRLGAPEPGESRAAQHGEDALARSLLGAGPGYSTLEVPDVGPLRLLARQVRRAGGLVTLGVGEPLVAVRDAQHDVARTFLLAGSLTLAAALVAAFLAAAGALRPLRRMTAIAARVDAGDLSPRIAADARQATEVRILADAFDHMLDRLSEAFARQRTFVSDASHELRTPLTVIRGQLEVLARQRDPSPADVRRVERLVRGELDRIDRLVEDLLLLARTDEGRLPETHEIDIQPYFEELFEGLRHTAPRRFEFGAVPAGRLRADPDQIAQAVRNLTVNAIEHTGEGGLVRVSVAADGEWLSCAVEDDGPGVPSDQRDRIFERFHRVDPSRTRGVGGTGLGLAIVRAVVEVHGGRLSVSDSPEGGARIGFALPGFKPEPPRPASPTEPLTPARGAANTG